VSGILGLSPLGKIFVFGNMVEWKVSMDSSVPYQIKSLGRIDDLKIGIAKIFAALMPRLTKAMVLPLPPNTSRLTKESTACV
jgi:hypothetical protein